MFLLCASWNRYSTELGCTDPNETEVVIPLWFNKSKNIFDSLSQCLSSTNKLSFGKVYLFSHSSNFVPYDAITCVWGKWLCRSINPGKIILDPKSIVSVFSYFLLSL